MALTDIILAESWNKYNSIRIAGDKKTANKLLECFITLLKQQNENVIKHFVDGLCEDILDKAEDILANNGADVSKNEIRIQHPLFKEIIAPVLAKEYKNSSPKHLKWIGQLAYFFYTDKETTKAFLKQIGIEGNFSPFFFMEKSFALEKDEHTLQLILKRSAADIKYFLHEVPCGVLVEPEYLNEELRVFKVYFEQSVNKGEWTNLLTNWENIALHWSDYCKNKNEYYDFKDYLDKNRINSIVAS